MPRIMEYITKDFSIRVNLQDGTTNMLYCGLQHTREFSPSTSAIIVHDHMATICTHTGTNQAGLVQWYWFSVEGKHGKTTRLVSAYQPCRTTNKSHASVYLQHRIYFRKRGDNRCPRLIFRINLEK